MKIFKLINTILIIVALLLSYKIFISKDINLEKLHNLYNKMNAHYSLIHSSSVSMSLNYVAVDDYKYKNDSYKIVNIKDGVVIKCDDNCLTLKYSDGYYGFYKDYVKLNVSLYDCLKSDDVIGYFDDYFVFCFYKDNMIYTYEKIMDNN